MRICVSLRADTTHELLSRMESLPHDVDLVEIRADLLRDLNIPSLLENRKFPVIFTLRPLHEGGHFEGSVEERHRAHLKALESGADYLDVEGDLDLRLLQRNKRQTRIIYSHHNFERTPDLRRQFEIMASIPADVYKIAAFGASYADVMEFFELLERARQAKKNVIAIAMGAKGLCTRVLGPARGSFLTYAAEEGDRATAPGQPTLRELLEVYRVRRINAETILVGLIGSPIGHSLSPLLHNRAAQHLGVNLCYLPFPCEELEPFFRLFDHLGMKGLSVTLPHKRAVLSYVHELHPVAGQVGAVNTVMVRDGKRLGYNTDVEGFLQPLVERMTLEGRRAAVLGAGGAARAVVAALRQSGVAVTVLNRTFHRGRQLAQAFGAEVGGLEQLPRLSYDLLVNATPVGMHPQVNESPIPVGDLRPGSLVYDLVYNPPETLLLRGARSRGCAVLGGVEMFVHQAALQFELWTGQRPPVEMLRDLVLDELGKA